MDEYYKQLTRGKFGSKKAWHVTTRLAKRLLVEVVAPRVGVVKALHAGDLTQIARTIFWASLRSLDIMERIQGNHFKNDSLVSSELVKFLAINTGFEAIESLTKSVADNKESIEKVTKLSVSADKEAGATANKADEGKRSLDAALERNVKIESKLKIESKQYDELAGKAAKPSWTEAPLANKK
jgi:hypothetical protein